MFSFSLYAQNEKRITGTIVDENNVPVAGAAVLEKGTTKGVFSNADGYFELSVSENSVLEFSFIGFFTQEIPVKGKVTLRVVMKEDAQSLSEVLVIGYGSVKKNDLTGSVTAIDSKKFTQGVVSNPASLITGKVAGVISIWKYVIPNIRIVWQIFGVTKFFGNFKLNSFPVDIGLNNTHLRQIDG